MCISIHNSHYRLKEHIGKTESRLTVWKYGRLPDFQQFCKLNHKPGVGLGKNVIYPTVLKQVL